MRKILLATIPVLIVLSLVAHWPSVGGGQPAATALPGARTEVQAANHPSLQAALDTLPKAGGVIRLPAGTFDITKPLVVTSDDVLIQGVGAATHIVNKNADGKPALVLRPADWEKDRKARIWRVKLADFRITGNEHSGNGIEAHGVNEILIDGVTVSEHGGHGIFLDHCYEDPRVCDSLITYNKQSGLELLGCHDIVVAANQFEENLDALRCLDGFNLCMTGNCLDDHLQHGVVIENTYGSVVSGNMIEECKGIACILDRDCYGITLSSNVIAHNFGGGIDLRDAHGCAVSANTFTIVPIAALRIGPVAGRITVTGNNFSDSYIGEGKERRRKNDQAASGIVLEGTRDVTITGNIFSGLSTKALEQAGKTVSERVVFANNVLTEVKGDAAELEQSVVANNIE